MRHAAEVLGLAHDLGLLDEVPSGPPEAVLAALLEAQRLSARTLHELEAEVEVRLLRSPAAPPVGETGALPALERYHPTGMLGEGGVGQVLRAYDPRLERFVALKILRARGGAEAILREAQAQARLEHPHVCKVYEVGEERGVSYIAMQLVKGPTLAAATGLSREEKLRIMRDVADGVHAAHGQGLIHRDLKPGNILLERSAEGPWHPYITDFGLAQDMGGAAGEAGLAGVVGTPPFMAPEQARGDGVVDARADVYALGATLYALFCGRPPFSGPVEEVLRDVVAREPLRPRLLAPSLPRDVEAIIRHAMDKEPARRYPTARELADDLGRWLDGRPVRARRGGFLGAGLRRARRQPLLFGAAAAALAAAAVLAPLWVVERRGAARRAELAQDLGRRVEEMTGIMREAYLLPPHDLRPEKARVRAELDAIRRAMAAQGAVAEPLGQEALGRGHLALHEHEQARAHLGRARELGVRGPETALALGLTLTALYSQGLAVADTLDAATREARQRELRAEYREPALRLLREAAPGPEGAEVEALIAYHEGRAEDALALARRASASSSPGSYGALRMEGEALLLLSREQPPDDRRLVKLALAGGPLGRALEIGRSDPELWQLECERLVAAAAVMRRLGRAAAAELDQGAVACDRATSGDPDQAGPRVTRSMLHAERSRLLDSAGGDARAELDAAVADAEAATRLAPARVEGWIGLGQALEMRAKWEGNHGGEVEATIERSVLALERAAALAPTSGTAPRLIGLSLTTANYFAMRRGAARLDLLGRAVAAYELSLRLSPSPEGSAELAHALASLGSAMGRAGQPWRPTFGRAVTAALSARARRPGNDIALYQLGEVYFMWARQEGEDGADPRPAVALAEEALVRAIAANPTADLPVQSLATVLQMRLAEEMRLGQDDPALAARIAETFGRALALKPDNWVVHFNRARHHALYGGWLLDHGAPADRVQPLLAQARASIDAAARLNPKSDSTVGMLAHLLTIEWELARREKGDVRAAYAAAVAAYERALAMNPDNAYTLAGLAGMHAQMGGWLLDEAGDAAAARRQAAAGRQLVERALALSPRTAVFLKEKERVDALAARAADARRPRPSDP